MKKLLKSMIIAFAIMSMMVNQYQVYAASFSVSKSTSSVSAGGKFSVSVSVSGAGKFSVSASNGTVSSQSLWVDGSGSVSVTAGQSGTVKVTVTAVDVTGYDESAITGSKTVSVKIKSTSTQQNTNTHTTNDSSNKGTTSQNTTNNSSNKATTNQNTTNDSKTSTIQDTRSTVNTLSSLTVNNGSIAPKFSASTTKYNVNVDANETSITISASAKDSKATVSGTGKKTLKVGENTFKIKCTAENGSTKVYTVIVKVDEKPLVYTEYNGKKLGVVRDLEDISVPDSFEETTVKLEDKEVTAYHSNLMEKTILYLVDENDEKDFYLYEEDKGIVSIFTPITILGRNLYVVDLSEDQQREGMIYQELTIDNNKLMGWVYEDKAYANYSLITVMNEQGKMVTYQYEKTEDSLQLYLDPIENDDSSQNDTILLYVFIALSVILAIACIGLIVYIQKFKKKSISAIKEYYDRKNQG